MASTSLSVASLSLVSDLLRSSSNGVPLRALGRAKLGVTKRDVSISAKRGKSEYPWGDDPLGPIPNPNAEDGVLGRMSSFKPLKETRKPVVLDFENPLMDIQMKIADVQKMANETGLDFSDQILSLEREYQKILKDKVDKLKQQIVEASKSPTGSLETGLKEMIDILKIEVKREYDEAAKALGMWEKVLIMRKEAEKANDQLRDSPLNEKFKGVWDELNKKLPSAPNYSSLMDKRDMLQELSKAFNFLYKRTSKDVKTKINKRFKQVVDRLDMKQKIKELRAEVSNSGLSDINSNPELKEKVMQLNRKLDSEFRTLLKSLGLEVVPTDPGTIAKIDAFKTEINMIKDKIELLKAEVAEAGNTPDEYSKSKIEALVAETEQAIRDDIRSPELKEKLLAEISEAIESSSSIESTSDSEAVKSSSSIESTADSKAVESSSSIESTADYQLV